MEDNKVVGFSFFSFISPNFSTFYLLKSLDLASKIWAASLYNMIGCIDISMEDNEVIGFFLCVFPNFFSFSLMSPKVPVAK